MTKACGMSQRNMYSYSLLLLGDEVAGAKYIVKFKLTPIAITLNHEVV